MPTRGLGRLTSSSAARPADGLHDKANAFAATLQNLLRATLPGEHAVSIERKPPAAYIVHTSSAGGRDPGHVPLRVKGHDRPIASLSISMSLRPDRTGQYLAVAQSRFVLWNEWDGRPLVRLEFLDAMHKAPCCHWQFHGENPRFAHLLQATSAKGARQLSALHFPVGGARMRPGVEDFLQFVIQECGFEAKSDWRRAIRRHRTEWRLRQTRTMVREAPYTAAKALAEHLGVRILRLGRLAKVEDDVSPRYAHW